MWEGKVEIAIHASLWSNWRKYGVLNETFAAACSGKADVWRTVERMD
jgi:hypothetical protein